MNIKTEYVHPPIPIRCYDWRAYVDGHEEGPFGWGATKEEAIEELKAELADREETAADA